MTNNSKTKAKITTPNVPIPITIEILQFLLKKGQYIVPNNIVDQYAHVCYRESETRVTLEREQEMRYGIIKAYCLLNN